jgi:deferrochelatase/peroxidase EfeB
VFGLVSGGAPEASDLTAVVDGNVSGRVLHKVAGRFPHLEGSDLSMMDEVGKVSSGIRRRVVLVGASVVALGGVAAATLWSGGEKQVSVSANLPRTFRQPGVVSSPPASAVVAAFDVAVRDVERLFRGVSAAIGDAEVTVAVGASLFDGRFGLAGLAPRRLTIMPSFPNDVLDPARCHGDLLVQVCAADSQAANAVLKRITDAAGSALVARWSVEGFRDEKTVTVDGKPSNRDLFGFREGVGNPDPRDGGLMDRLVWVAGGGGEPGWAVGGSYQVVRVIRFAPALWDGESVARQESVLGRRKADGAPLGRDGEDAAFDYVSDPSGQVIALDAHIRRANPRTPETDDSRILRRGYSFRSAGGSGVRDEGLVFICFQQDVERGFATVQRRLAGQALDKYILPVGGGYFFVLPGRGDGPGGYLGESLIQAAGAGAR